MTPLARRIVALEAKLAVLGTEIDAWSALRGKPPFKIHTSQIDDVCGALANMRRNVADEVEAAKATLTPEQVERYERKILAILQIWACYRDKFALRLSQWLQEPLSLLDELAWHAYRPARDAAVASGAVQAVEVREPPLVFLDTQWSPFARSRQQAYLIDESAGEVYAFPDFDEWLRRVPVPLVGVPWFQTAHLPDAVFIGHEAGHLVEEDFGLDQALAAAILAVLENANAERRAAWSRHWRSEIFADVYGVLATGPAYAATLLDLLAGDAAAVRSETRPVKGSWGAYPTRALRALLVCEAVRQLPGDEKSPAIFSDCADGLEKRWIAAYPEHAMPDYSQDVPAVVHALLTTPLPAFRTKETPDGRPLTSVLKFDASQERAARKDAAAALAMQPLAGRDVRALFAGVARAFQDAPQQFGPRNVQARFQLRLLERRAAAPRNREVPKFTPALRAERHRATSAALLGRLAALDEGPEKLVHAPSGMEFPLSLYDTEIGRKDPVTGIYPDVDLTTVDPQRSVSRRHAKIYRRGAKFFLGEEIGTMSSTFLNGTALETGVPLEIRPGDELRVGLVSLKFLVP